MIHTLITSKTKRELLQYFLFSSDTPQNYARSLAKKLNLSYMPVQKELWKLTKLGFLTQKKTGPTVVYCLNSGYPLYRELKALFEKNQVVRQSSNIMPEKVKGAIDLIKEHLPQGSRLFLFGSRANENAKPNSDWDIGFISPQKMNLKNLLTLKNNAREVSWPYRMDVVDFNQVTQDFKDLALKQTINL